MDVRTEAKTAPPAAMVTTRLGTTGQDGMPVVDVPMADTAGSAFKDCPWPYGFAWPAARQIAPSSATASVVAWTRVDASVPAPAMVAGRLVPIRCCLIPTMTVP